MNKNNWKNIQIGDKLKNHNFPDYIIEILGICGDKIFTSLKNSDILCCFFTRKELKKRGWTVIK